MTLLFGRPLATSEERAEHIGPLAGIPVFGLDALSSAAYGPEAALTLLIPLGLMGVHYIVPVSAAIVALLTIVYFSYRQTIDAYPQGGGSYTVASQNLGEGAGLLAAAALMIDYILTAAVGISAGVGALISAAPGLQPYTLELCLAVLLILTIVNMRGVHDTGVVFMIPTYLFTGTLLIVIGVGAWQVLHSGGHPHPVTPLPAIPAPIALVSWWLIAKVFSSGCTAMTGVEAVSNGVMAFRDDTRRNAKITLTIIIVLLAALLAGIALLCRAYGIAATDPGSRGYESVLSMLTRAVMGHGWFYYVTIASVLLVLALSANTAFADFPRLTRAIALDDYMPRVFLLRGRRLLYSWGIYVLVALTALLLIVFGGITDRLIPLFAIGDGSADPDHDHGHARRQAPLRPRGPRNRPRPPHRPRRRHRAHRGAAHRPLEPHLGEGAELCALHVQRYPLPARADQRRAGRDLQGLGEGCGRSTARRRKMRSQTRNPAIALPLRPRARDRLRPQGGTRVQLPQDLRSGAGVGGAPLVAEPAPQPPRRHAQSDPLDARQPPHHRDQHPLVSRRQMSRRRSSGGTEASGPREFSSPGPVHLNFAAPAVCAAILTRAIVFGGSRGIHAPEQSG